MGLYEELVQAIQGPKGLDDGPCWIWERALLTGGYGCLDARHKGPHPSKLTHRVSYEVAYGAIPAGLEIDHICRVRACYRPAHLRVVTHRENCLAPGAMTCSAVASRRTHCKNGHELTPDNLLLSNLRSKNGCRSCRQCERERSAARRATAKMEK